LGKNGTILKVYNPEYDDIGIYSIHQHFSLSLGVRLLFRMSPYLNILCISVEQPYYIENNNLHMTFTYCIQFPQNSQSQL